MANLVTWYLSKTGIINRKKKFIRGDIIEYIYDDTYCFQKYKIYKLHLVNKKNNFIEFKRCKKCNKYHISDKEFQEYLGIHWMKYKQRYWELKISINFDNNCNE